MVGRLQATGPAALPGLVSDTCSGHTQLRKCIRHHPCFDGDSMRSGRLRAWGSLRGWPKKECSTHRVLVETAIFSAVTWRVYFGPGPRVTDEWAIQTLAGQEEEARLFLLWVHRTLCTGTSKPILLYFLLAQSAVVRLGSPQGL